MQSHTICVGAWLRLHTHTWRPILHVSTALRMLVPWDSARQHPAGQNPALELGLRQMFGMGRADVQHSPTSAGVTLSRGEDAFHAVGEDGDQLYIPICAIRKSTVLSDLWDDSPKGCHVSTTPAGLAGWIDWVVHGMRPGGPRDPAKLLIDVIMVRHLMLAFFTGEAVENGRGMGSSGGSAGSIGRLSCSVLH